MNYWLILGFIAQGLFAARFIVQWIATERHKQSVVPIHFWYFSIAGAILLLIYSIYRQDPVFILGQSAGMLVYSRNLYFIRKAKQRAAAPGADNAGA